MPILFCYFVFFLLLSFSDPNEVNVIAAEGIERMLKDLNLSPDHLLVLVLAWKLKAEQQCVFTRDEFINGMLDMKLEKDTKLLGLPSCM